MKVIMGAADLVGTIIFAPFSFIRKKLTVKKEPRNILVVRLDQIGDMIQALPFFEALKKKYPQSVVHVVCVKDCAFLLGKNRNVDRLYSMTSSWFYSERKLKLKEYNELAKTLKLIGIDEAYDLRGDIRNLLLLKFCGAKKIKGYDCAGGGFLIDEKTTYDRNEHEINKNLKLLNVKAEKEVIIDFSKSVSDEKAAQTFIEETGGHKLKNVIIHPFTRAKSKMWGIEKYTALVEKLLKNDNIRIFIIGGKDDILHEKSFIWNNRVVNCIGKFGFGFTVELMRLSHVFIGNDSGPQYFAAYSGLKTCVIYGNTVNYKRWQPMVKEGNLMPLSKPTDCGPCELSLCNQKTHVCMDIISVDDVYHAVEKWL